MITTGQDREKCLRSARFRVRKQHHALFAALHELGQGYFVAVVVLDLTTEALEVDFVALLGRAGGGLLRGLFVGCCIFFGGFFLSSGGLLSCGGFLSSYGLLGFGRLFLRPAFGCGLFLRRRSCRRRGWTFA